VCSLHMCLCMCRCRCVFSIQQWQGSVFGVQGLVIRVQGLGFRAGLPEGARQARTAPAHYFLLLLSSSDRGAACVYPGVSPANHPRKYLLQAHAPNSSPPCWAGCLPASARGGLSGSYFVLLVTSFMCLTGHVPVTCCPPRVTGHVPFTWQRQGWSEERGELASAPTSSTALAPLAGTSFRYPFALLCSALLSSPLLSSASLYPIQFHSNSHLLQLPRHPLLRHLQLRGLRGTGRGRQERRGGRRAVGWGSRGKQGSRLLPFRVCGGLRFAGQCRV